MRWEKLALEIAALALVLVGPYLLVRMLDLRLGEKVRLLRLVLMLVLLGVGTLPALQLWTAWHVAVPLNVFSAAALVANLEAILLAWFGSHANKEDGKSLLLALFVTLVSPILLAADLMGMVN
jgi:hypothetical protein